MLFVDSQRISVVLLPVRVHAFYGIRHLRPAHRRSRRCHHAEVNAGFAQHVPPVVFTAVVADALYYGNRFELRARRNVRPRARRVQTATGRSRLSRYLPMMLAL